MKIKELKHTPIGYFKYFYEALGVKFIVNIFLSVLLGLFDGVGLALFIPLLQFIGDDKKSTGNNETMGGLSFVLDGFSALNIPLTVFSILCFILLIFTIKGILTYVISMEQVDLRQKYGIGLRLKQIYEIEALSYKGFLKLDAGNIQNSFTTEIGRNMAAMIQFMSTIKGAILLLTYVILAFLANWQFAILIIGGGLLSNLLFKKINKSVKEASILISSRNGLFNGYIIQSINTFKYLKSTNYFPRYVKKLEKVVADVEVLNRSIGKNQSISMSLREPIIMFIVVLVILLQIYVFKSTLGSILLSLLLFYRALSGLMGVQGSWQIFLQNIGSLENIRNTSSLMEEYKEHNEGFDFKSLSNELALNNVSFSYGKKNIIKNLSIKIEKNQTIAFVGESGSGKTTLANIFITLLSPSEGEYLIDGIPLKNYNISSFRSKIGYITQEAVIYSDTVYNNITFWAEKTPENINKFWRVIEQVALYNFVNNLPEKEDASLGDNGINISGGQKQRISIARELYKDIDILVMDEATSALDSETENYIRNSINELKGRFTMIIIAHRLSTIKNADNIFLMEDGKVIENGDFEELQNKSLKFKTMVDLQNIGKI